MSWQVRYSLDNIDFFIDSGGFHAPGTRISFAVEQLPRVSTAQFEEIKAWILENGAEIAALEFARECDWDRQFLSSDELLLILNGKHASDEERHRARQLIDDALLGRRAPRPEKSITTRRKVAGYVYLLAADNGLYKVGKALKLDERVTHLSVKLPVRITLVHAIESDDYSWAELYFHDKFANKRDHGEWFKLDANDLAEFQLLKRLDSPQ